MNSQCLAAACPEPPTTTTTTTSTTEKEVEDSELPVQQAEPEFVPSIVAAVESTTSSGYSTYSPRAFIGMAFLVTVVLVFGSC